MGFGFSRSEQAAYYNQGVFIDLTDLVEEHGYYIKEMFEKEPIVEIVHGGLECGILSARIPELDCISFGPDIFDVHSV